MDGQNQNPMEPVDISQAFQMLRAGDGQKPDAQAESVEPEGQEEGLDGSGEGAGGGQPQDAGVPGAGSDDQGGDDGGQSVDTGSDDGDGAGGSSAEYEGFDYQASRESLINSLQEQAARETAKTFQDHNVKMMSIQDIYRRDEDGTVHFDNPDDPHREFNSRAEAQAWIESMNKEINRAFNEEARKRTQELYQQAAPAIMLLEFAPTYDAMDDNIKAVFNDLVEPYSVTNASGEIIGFSCNLNQMAVQAKNIAARFNYTGEQQQGKQEEKAPQKVSKDQEPALDIKTGSGVTTNEEEPKNIEEAMAMLNKSKKEKSNG